MQSQGTLHVFLPLLDRGLDAVLHRMTDGRYIPFRSKAEARRSREWWRSSFGAIVSSTTARF
jgi:hypothetical protein